MKSFIPYIEAAVFLALVPGLPVTVWLMAAVML
jgi:hypothetical protein